MTYRLIGTTGLLLAVLHTPAFTAGDGQPLPLRNGRPIVATVNADVISLDELLMELDSTADRARLQQGRATEQQIGVVNRLVTVKLLVQEAARMGLADVPQVRKEADVASREILREVLLEQLTKNVKADPAVVEKNFREAVRQWKTSSLVFQDEAAAKKAQAELESGAAFATVAARVVAAKTGKPDKDNDYHAAKDYLPQIGTALGKLRIGQVSPVLHLQAGFVVVKVIDIRYPENAPARAQARKAALAEKQIAFTKTHEEWLRRQYATIDTRLLKSLDYQAPRPGLDALLKDTRVLARIKGAAPLTVGDLTDYLRLQFFHGSDPARQGKEMNEKKETAFYATLGRRLLNQEAVRLGIDKTNRYRDRVTGYRDTLVFSAFVQKVIAPENKMKEEEVKGYYTVNLKNYSYPDMMKIRSLAFTRRGAAEDALRKLREGSDYGWVSSNAEGQVDKGAEGLLSFDGQPVMTDSMPDALRTALTGCKSGDLRLYASPDGRFYVLSVQEVIANGAKPYDQVRDDVAKKLYGDKLQRGIDTYAARLRAQSKVATYLNKVH
jgi:parvulin-like peptidyl-prolyl isomerase